MKSILFTLYLFSGSFLLAQTSVNNYTTLSTLVTEALEQNKSSITAEVSKKITYEDHLHAAKSFEIPLIENDEHMDSLVHENKLLPVPEIGEGYKIQKLTHSRAFLNEPAYILLKEIAASFYKETGKELSISSLTRTMGNQSKLRRVNGNAAKGDSAHNYGVSFDISYNKYGDKIGRNYAFERLMENMLMQLAEQGKLYYIKERKQPCYHITLRKFDNVEHSEYIEHSDHI